MSDSPILLDKKRFWDIIVSYYFDEIHWASGVSKGVRVTEWLQEEFGATTTVDSVHIAFDDPKKASWFVLRWS